MESILSQPTYSLAAARLTRFLRWVVRNYVPAKPTPIEEVDSQLDEMLGLLEDWCLGNPATRGNWFPEFAQNKSGLLTELWCRGLIGVAVRRDDKFNPLTRLDVSRQTRLATKFTPEGCLLTRLAPLDPPRPVQFEVSVHNPRGRSKRVTYGVIGYDPHVWRVLDQRSTYSTVACNVTERVPDEAPAAPPPKASSPSPNQASTPPPTTIAPASSGAIGHPANGWLNTEINRRLDCGLPVNTDKDAVQELIARWQEKHPDEDPPKVRAVRQLIYRERDRRHE